MTADMKSEWRPPGWLNPYHSSHMKDVDILLSRTYEAGASAMLEALRKEPSSKTVHFDKYAKMNHFRDGIVVFIPDEK